MLIFLSSRRLYPFFFFFNDTATTEIYTLSLHDALPICAAAQQRRLVELLVEQLRHRTCDRTNCQVAHGFNLCGGRSEEHTSELQSHHDLVCRLLLEKKNSDLDRQTSMTIKTLAHQVVQT